MLGSLLKNIFSRNSGQKKSADQLVKAGLEIESTINDDEPHNMQALMQKALASYRQALAINPEHAAAAAYAALLLDKLGDIESARALLKPFLVNEEITPVIADVYGKICHRPGETAHGIKIIERVLTTKDMPDNHRYELHFTLGGLYDKSRNYDKAFSNYKIGNNKFPPVKPILPDLVPSLIEVFSKENLENYPRSTIESDLPVFIIGMGKSGTSLVEQFIASHSGVYGAGELKLMFSLGIRGGLSRSIHSDRPFPYCMADLTQQHVDDVARVYLDKLRGYSARARRITDKLPANFLHLGLISVLFPQARIIHCTRAPLDNCLSLYTAPFSIPEFFSKNLDSIAEYYRQYRKLMAHWDDVLDIKMMTVAYEDVVGNPESNIKSVIEFCGLDWEDQCLDFYNSDRLVTTSSFDKVRQPVYKSAVGRWKNYEKHLKPLQEKLSPWID